MRGKTRQKCSGSDSAAGWGSPSALCISSMPLLFVTTPITKREVEAHLPLGQIILETHIAQGAGGNPPMLVSTRSLKASKSAIQIFTAAENFGGVGTACGAFGGNSAANIAGRPTSVLFRHGQCPLLTR